MNKIKVMFVHGFLGAGGAEELKLTILKYLDKTKYLPVVCSLSTKGIIGKEIEQLGIKVIVLHQTQDIHNIKTTYLLYKLFQKEKPDIIEACMFNASFHSIIAGKFAKIKKICVEIHSSGYFKKWWHIRIDQFLFQFVYKIITCSEFVNKLTAEREQIPQYKFKTILNIIDPEKLDKYENTQKLRKRLNINKKQKIIGIIGRLHIQKGHIYLLKALQTIRKQFPDIVLLVIGTGPLEAELKKFCDLNNLQKNVKFLGVRRDIPSLIKLMNITILPSTCEGFGIVLLESLYCEVPCVASRVGGIPEVMKNGKHGFLVSPKDPEKLANAIIKLLVNTKLAKKMGCEGRIWVKQNFMPARYINTLDELYLSPVN